jgi:hypothetical protein
VLEWQCMTTHRDGLFEGEEAVLHVMERIVNGVSLPAECDILGVLPLCRRSPRLFAPGDPVAAGRHEPP